MASNKEKQSDEKVERFLKYLESELKAEKITVPQFAKLMKVPSMTVYKWLNRDSVMSLTKYFTALEVLGIETSLSRKPKVIKSTKIKF